MGCCAPDPPPPPDYAASAQAQGQANLDAARATATLDRPNINSWQGSQTWEKDPNQPDHYTVTNSLNPAEQQKYETGNRIQNALLGTLESSGIKPIQDALSADYKLPGSYQMNPDGPGPGAFQTDVNYGGAPRGQSDLDFSGAPGMPQDNMAARDRSEQAAYSRGSRYLDSQYTQQQQAMEAKLANQGIAPGSDAYKQAMQDFGDQRARDYGNLRDSSIATGDTELGQTFNRGMQARQQGVAETSAQGQFRNSARQQAIQEILSAFQGHNTGVAQAGQLGLAQQQGRNAARSGALQEMVQSKTLPINVLTSLLSGSQVNAPQFQPFNNQIQVDAAPIMQGAQLQGQQSIAGQNAQSSQNGQLCSSGATVGAAFLL